MPETSPQPEQVDAVIVGANIRGLIAAHLCGQLGFSAVLIERSAAIGGVDGSFTTPAGVRFDHGLHVLDYMRSQVSTKLLVRMVEGEVHRVTLKRGLVLRGQVMPYSPHPKQMPQELQDMLLGDELVDDVGDDLPTRANLARCYGPRFADFILDEVLASYPTENRHRQFGVDEARLLANVYPWLLPRARRAPKHGDESRTYHDKLRQGVDQDIVYPKQGGFGGFAQGFLRHLDPDYVEVITGASDFELEVDQASHRALGARAKGRRFVAKNYFWAAPWGVLCRMLDVPCQDTATDRVLLGAFVLDRPANSPYHELLVADPELHMNRVFFPSRFREQDEPLVQVEFAVPRAEDWSDDAEHWQQRWLADMRRMGVLDSSHQVLEFDYKSIPLHFNAFGMEGVPLTDANTGLLKPGSNIRPVTPSLSNLNLNGHVPRDVSYVASILAAPPESD